MKRICTVGLQLCFMGRSKFFVTTNEKETKYFNVDKNYIPKELIEVVALPTAMEAVSEKKIKELLNKTKKPLLEMSLQKR